MSHQVQQVTTRLDVRLDGKSTVVIAIAEARAHNKEVRVVDEHQRITPRGIIQIVFPELVANPGHRDEIQFEHVYLVAVVTLWIVPFIAPTGIHHTTQKLGTILQIVQQRDLRRCVDTLTERVGQKGGNESWERQTRLQTVFQEVGVGIALESLDGLIGSAQFDGEQFGTTEDVTVLIGQRGGKSQVTRGIGTFWLKRNRRRFVGA